jgi:hypothetical protein
MKLLRNSEVPIEKWNYLLLKSPYSSPFQTREFFQLYNSVPSLSAEVFAVEDFGNLKSLCVVTIQKEEGLKAFFSRRAIIYGGPLFISHDYDTGEFLLHHVYLELNKKVIYIEVRNYADYGKMKSLYVNAGWMWLPYLNIKLLLKDNSLNHVLGLMKYNRRREIKQSLNEGAIYREANNIQEVENLYLILKGIYLSKIKLPIPKLDFFLAIYRSIIGKVFIVLHNEQIIGGAFCIFLENESIYTMYYCGKRNYHMKIFPTHLSILAAIEFGIKNKLEYIDFMGAGLKNKEYGVRKFKQEFGGELLEYGRFRKINNTFLFVIGELGLHILKLLKK